MTGYTREKLLMTHEQLVDNEDSLIADGDIGIGDSGVSSALRAGGGKEPPVAIKIGNAKAVGPKGAVFDITHLVVDDTDMVVVRGGSATVDETLEEFGEEPTRVESPSGTSGRFIDGRTMEVSSMVMPGKLNIDLTALFRKTGVDTLDLSGVDGDFLTGPRKSAVRVVEDGKKKIKRSDHSEKVTSVNTALLEILLDGGYAPITTVPMLADDDAPVNVGADCAAIVVAGAFSVKLAVLVDVKGVCADPDGEFILIETADTPERLSALESAAEGLMTKKVMAAEEALDGGAAEVVVTDANLSDPVMMALNGGGTHVVPSALVGTREAGQ